MRVLVRLGAARFVALVLALLLNGVILNNARTTVFAARVGSAHVREVELLRSLARYRLLLEHDDSARDRLVQAEKLETMPEQAEEKEIKAANTDLAVETSEKKEDKLESVFEVQGKQNETIKIDEIERPVNVADDVRNAENGDEEPKADRIETATENEEHSTAHTEEQQVHGEQLEHEQTPRTAPKSELNAENQLQAEVREEPQSKDKIPDHDVLKEESVVKGIEGQTAVKEEVAKKEENNPMVENESESKTEDATTDESREVKSGSKTEETQPKEEEPFIFPEPYLLGPTIKDWDEQRENWLNANCKMKATAEGKPRVLIVTGSQPNPCHSPVGDNFNVKSLKLKIDYARIHNYEIYYNFVWLDPLFGSYWVKLPIVRKLMLTHPEIEWFFWIDSDAIFTDMLFEAPFHTYDSEGANMIMWGYPKGFYVDKSWVAFNAGVFIIRNCQWSLDLIDKWSPMGPDGPVQVEYGKILSSFLSNRPGSYSADDQSALAYLILTDEAVKAKVKLVDLTEYMVSAWWVEVVDNYETSMEKYHPGLGDWRWPWITHFTGCGPCNGDGSRPDYQKCMKHIERALNFADNQVLAYMGFQHESLSSDSLIRTRNESDRPLESLGVNPWAERIAEVAATAR